MPVKLFAARTVSAVAVVGAACALSMAAGGGLSAAVSSDTSADAAEARRPSCIAVRVVVFNNIAVTNNCGVAKNLKVIWANAPDSSCFTLAAGATVGKHSTIGAYRDIVYC